MMRLLSILIPVGLVLVPPSPAHSQAAGAGIPFGLFGMRGRDLADPYTSAMQQAQPKTLMADLAAANERQARIVVNLTGGGRNNLTGPDGRFDVNLWKARVDQYRPLASQLSGYLADGTLLAVLLIDEPFVKPRWGGEAVPPETLDEMAAYVKALVPGVPTAVGAAPLELEHYSWKQLDAAWAQYASRKGTAADYAAKQSAAARRAKLGLIVGLNISKGGDGSSGRGTPKEWTMTGSEILEDGRALLEIPEACAFISWDKRPEVVNRPDVAAAMAQLASIARSHPTASCRRPG